MISVSDITKELYNRDRATKSIRVRVWNSSTSYNDYLNDKVYTESFKLTQSIMEQTAEIVGCISSKMEVKLHIDDVSLLNSVEYAGKKISVWMNVTEGENVGDEVQLFTGYVDSADKNAVAKSLNLVCYDAIGFFNDIKVYNAYRNAFKSGFAINGKIKIEDFRDYMFGQCTDTEQEYTRLPNDEVIIKKRSNNKDMTMMDIVKHLCQINGCFGYIRPDGVFDYRFIDTREESAFDIPIYRSLTFQESYIQLLKNGMTIRTSNTDAGVNCNWNENSPDYYQKWLPDDVDWGDDTEDSYLVGDDDDDIMDGMYVIEGNFFAYKLSRKKKHIISANILRKCGRDIVFREYEAVCNAMPFLQCGDKIKFITAHKNSNEPIIREFIITKRVISGIQNMTDTFSCKPSFKYTSVDAGTGEKEDIKPEGSYVSNLPSTEIGTNDLKDAGEKVAVILDEQQIMVVSNWNNTTKMLETTSEEIEI